MKHSFYIFLWAFIFPVVAMAQPEQNKARSEHFFVGIKGGLSIPTLQSGESSNDWNKDYASRLGPYFGGLVELPLSRHFSFQAELVYAAEGGKRNNIQPMAIPEEYLAIFQKAFKTDQDYLFANLNSVSRINYIQMPLMLKYHYPIAANGKLQVFAQAGLCPGYMVQSKQIVKSENLRVYFDGEGKAEIPESLVHSSFGSSIDTVIDARNDLHSWNIGIQGAIGFSYQIGCGKIFIEGGGNYGFVPVQKTDDHGKNNIGAGTVLLGYAMQLSKR